MSTQTGAKPEAEANAAGGTVVQLRGHDVLKEGWASKLSGKALFGQYHWDRRWFRLVQRGADVTLYYYKAIKDEDPRGQVRLTSNYVAREIEAGERVKKPHAFAVGKLVDDGATRTYYLSCESEEDKLEWMATIGAAIEGVPDRALKRKSTVRVKMKNKVQTLPTSEIGATVTKQKYEDPKWRMQQWEGLCEMIDRPVDQWKKWESKEGVAVARMSFKEQPYAIIMVDGTVEAPCSIVYSFLQQACAEGGKLDYFFRDERVLQSIDPDRANSVVQWHYKTSLPGMTPREDATLCRVELSGVVLKPDTKSPNKTRMTFLAQVDVRGSLRGMLKQSYKSGLLVRGFRTSYQHLVEEVATYMKVVSM
ncbi:PREDICTED: uncharacterized protein LOC109462871 [Branchiostoma belcheri]|uniref:Uncharacterized protein LOC109462871 n=1 Tax=Branchiostoma belcheri TaxID=7741 RepID=A0A6P4XSM4_BRABE|nr:PREDICTED: uncharacterized protein LOC109462871 [Branchiostoma belcheri]